MRNFKSANVDEKDEIIAVLREAEGDLLVGFPLEETRWYSADLEDTDIEKLFLFWDGSAWSQDSTIPPRRLRDGLRDFIALAQEPRDKWSPHLKKIVNIKVALHAGANVDLRLVLISKDQSDPYVILDGNKRAVATLWQVHETSQRDLLATRVWVGLSPNMTRYPWYQRVYQSGRS